MPQGAILGPLLFIVYINDLPRCVKHCSVNMYADHTVLFSNFITIGSGNEGSEDDDTQKVDDKSDTTVQLPVMLTIMQPVIFNQQKSPSYK